MHYWERSCYLCAFWRLKGPILSRFDLVFILIDRADDELDYRLSEHVLAQHNRSIRSSHNNTTVSSTRTQHETTTANSNSVNDISLLDHLRLKPGETIEPIGPSLLQKVEIVYFSKKNKNSSHFTVHCLCSSIRKTTFNTRSNQRFENILFRITCCSSTRWYNSHHPTTTGILNATHWSKKNPKIIDFTKYFLMI